MQSLFMILCKLWISYLCRQPFLFIDKVLELSKTHVVGVKNVTMNEDFFRGHFPGAPVMPGVLVDRGNGSGWWYFGVEYCARSAELPNLFFKN